MNNPKKNSPKKITDTSDNEHDAKLEELMDKAMEGDPLSMMTFLSRYGDEKWRMTEKELERFLKNFPKT